jgi:Bacterial CdiA-CT RNAse A domain
VRLAISGRGYASATEAFISGNRWAARACETLAGQLQGYAGMAGDDATATDFAASYDEAARESVEALADLVAAFGSLGHLAEASLSNHRAADARSVITRSVLDIAAPTLADRSVGILPATPPSSLGGDPSSLPGWANWVLDLLEGVIWPDADTDRLRQAAATWRTAAGSVDVLTSHCDQALRGFEDELSPEIPLAVATTQDLRRTVEELAAQLDALGTTCEEYAAHVDAKREEMLGLLEELVAELAAGAIAAGFLTFVSGGLAAAGGGALAGTRLAAAARELRAIVDALRVLTGGSAARLRPVAASVRTSRAYLSRLTAARLAARSERGSLDLGQFFHRGWLRAHEHSGSHTLARHVGKKDEELRARLFDDRRPPAASTFRDRGEAEHVIERTLCDNRDAIGEWMESGRRKRAFVTDLGVDVGRVLVRGSDEVVNGTKVRLVLVRDPSMPDGWRVLSAFPDL